MTRSADGSEENRGEYARIVPPAFVKDQWTWTDPSGKEQPEVALFSTRYQAGNPHLARLDQSYRAFALTMRDASCVGCHNPSNPQGVEWLTLLQTPAHAAGEIDRVIVAVQDGVMPQDEVGMRKELDPKVRDAMLGTAQAFRNELAAADLWEAGKRARAAVTPAAAKVAKSTD